jgi:hypothetical protein
VLFLYQTDDDIAFMLSATRRVERNSDELRDFTAAKTEYAAALRGG